MSGITVFNMKKISTGILGWNYRMIDDVMQDYVIDYYMIVNMIKLFFEKEMVQEKTGIPPNSSRVCIVWNGPVLLTMLTQLILEKRLFKIFGNFDYRCEDFDYE